MAAVTAAALITSTAPALAQSGGINVDGDLDLRCAVSRAVERSAIETMDRVIETIGVATTFDQVARGATVEANADHLALLSSLGLVSRDGSTLSRVGHALSAMRGDPGDAPATIRLEAGTSLSAGVATPDRDARFSYTAGDTGIVRIQVTPTGPGGEGCGVGFDPVVRASVAGAGGLEHVSRGGGKSRDAVLYLYDVPAGAAIDISVNDVVGAAGTFDIRADAVTREAPMISGSEPVIFVGDGGYSYLPIELAEGQSASVSMSISYEAREPSFSVVGLNGAQPGVRVYVTDGDGWIYGDPVFTSSYLPTPDGPGRYRRIPL